MGNIDSIILAEKSCENETKKVFPEIIEYYEKLYTFYLNISEKYCKSVPEGIVKRPVAIFFLNDRILKSLYCGFDLLKRGHYNECRSIQRDILEAICLIEYILANPAFSDTWFEGHQKSFSKIQKEISLLPGDDKIYGHLCDYTHPNVYSNIRESASIENESERGVYFSFMPYFQKNMCHSTFVLLNLLTHRAMTNYLEFIKRYDRDLSQEDVEKLRINNEKLLEIAQFLKIEYESDN